jgi:transcriptional regulator
VKDAYRPYLRRIRDEVAWAMRSRRIVVLRKQGLSMRVIALRLDLTAARICQLLKEASINQKRDE